jgi:D-alanyl-D-alanine carboxypeptidase
MKKYTLGAIIILLVIGLMTSCFKEDSMEAGDSAPPETITENVPETPYVNPDLDYLVLVDSSHPLPEGWEDSIEIESFTNAVGDEVKVERTAYEAYLKLKEALEADNVYVDLDSAYRSVEEQQKIVDGKIIYENEDLMQYPEIWEQIHEKLPDYGFILRYPGGNEYPYEPWHIRYVGLKAAQEITEKNMFFEDYI